ncbi:MAG TPA: RNA-protein complex protein Nop10 [Methanolinea sp.]|nr:RNA-protein complex protein Nop10 [Methanolinea sp.]HQK56032.1 RNA-protein complex protein Nop10 [Methanolinea sp.]
MSGRLRRCPRDRTYTLQDNCPACGGPTVSAHPARFSPDDRYGKYRREMKGWTR